MTNPHFADIDIHRKANSFCLMDANGVEVRPRFTLDISLQLMIWFCRLPPSSGSLRPEKKRRCASPVQPGNGDLKIREDCEVHARQSSRLWKQACLNAYSSDTGYQKNLQCTDPL